MASSFEVLALAKLSFADNMPTAYLNQTTAQSITSSSSFTQIIQFQTSTEDNWSGHSNVTNNTRYTAQVAGLYSIVGAYTSSNSAGLGVRASCLAKNGSLITGSQAYGQSYSNNFLTVNSSCLIRLAVGDYMELYVWQNSGGALNTVVGGCFLSAEYVHA